jgi:hemolysin activation/secretion protein
MHLVGVRTWGKRVLLKLVALTGTALTIGALPTHALAQANPTPPNPTREEIDRAPVAPVPPSAGQRVTVEGGVERAPCPLASADYKDITIKFDRIDFGDLKGIDLAILQPAYARYVGKTLPISTMCDIRDEAATLLRRKGYLAAVQVPPQRIDGGTVKFDVLIAKLVDFQVRGNAGKAESLIAGYLNAIKAQPIFNIIEAERYLLLARDIPGYDVRLTLRPAGGALGEVIGDVQVTYTPIEADANFQNYGSKAVGRFGGISQVRFNGLLGSGDRTTIGFYSTADFKEQLVGQLAEEIKIGRQGLTVGAGLTYAVTKPSVAGLDLTSKTLIGALTVRYPVVRSQASNVNLNGGFDFINQRARTAGTLITNDKIRILYARIDADALDAASLSDTTGYSGGEPRWRVLGSLEFRKGLGALGASLNCEATPRCPSRSDGDPKAFIIRASGYGEIRPIPKLTLSLAPRIQYSKKALLSFEEYSAGNYTVGRGFDPGTLSGDRGVGTSGEIKIGSLIAKSSKSFAIQPYAFGDVAVTWNRASDPTAPGKQRLYSAGGGIRAAYGQRINLDVGGAVPLKRAGLQTQRSDVRLLANLTIRFLPWTRR